MIKFPSFLDPAAQPSEARRLLSQGLLLGSGIAGAGTVVLSVVELIRSNPDKGFMLLEKWGPWFFLALFSVWALSGLLNRFLDVLADVGGRVASAMGRIADKQETMALAAQDQASATARLADRDDRERERMSTLVDYAGQESRKANESISAMQPILQQISEHLIKVAAKDGNDG